MSIFRHGLLVLAVLTGAGLEVACAPGLGGILGRERFHTERASVAPGGVGANDPSFHPAVSGDGLLVAFTSVASNLSPGDSSRWADVFVYDRRVGSVDRVSLSPDGTEGNDVSYDPFLSGDGRFVAFTSFASNLVAGDVYPGTDIFVRDRLAGVTELASVSSDAVQGNGDSDGPSISADGRFMAFSSLASNLASGDTNGLKDVFVRDRQARVTVRVSLSSDGFEGQGNSESASISADGRFITFDSDAANLVSGDTNERRDVFVHDRGTGVTQRVSLGGGGAQGTEASWGPSISGDGRIVVFTSFASDLVPDDNNVWRDVFVYDRESEVIERVSVAFDDQEEDGGSTARSVSSDGRFVVFSSLGSNLVSGYDNPQTDVYRYDRSTGQIKVVSVANDGAFGDHASIGASVSDDGRVVAFHSLASNLVPDDKNLAWDIFVRASGRR